MSFAAFAEDLLRRLSAQADSAVVWRTADSTNTAARRIAIEFAADEVVPPRVCVFAYEQTQGRGRQGRNWASPAGRGVYATLLLPAVPPEQLELLPLIAAVVLAEEIEAVALRPCRIKWPNDLVIEGKKIGGILIESLLRGSGPATAICGFGVNHSHTAAELPREAATSLALELPASGGLPSLAEAAARLALALAAALALPATGDAAGAMVTRYRARSLHVEGDMLRCSLGHGIVEGTFRGFDERGFLRLETAAGMRLLSAGEVIER